VAPGGGGTSIIAGSHRLLQLWDEKMQSLRSKDASAHRDWFQRAHPWLAALSGHVPGPNDRRAVFMDEGAEIEGIRVRVVEMSGEPGDMFLCHPTIVHCVSPNCGTWPRMMRIGGVLTDRLRMRLGRRVA
jgi:ectoine hydroxylase-related dioxygenase (phytanoyl-CoA dioxygenase family)